MLAGVASIFYYRKGWGGKETVKYTRYMIIIKLEYMRKHLTFV